MVNKTLNNPITLQITNAQALEQMPKQITDEIKRISPDGTIEGFIEEVNENDFSVFIEDEIQIIEVTDLDDLKKGIRRYIEGDVIYSFSVLRKKVSFTKAGE